MGKTQTADSMYYLAQKFSGDLEQFKNNSLPAFFRRVANLKYRKDPTGFEIVARPKWAFVLGRGPGADCKKKATILGAFLTLKKIPWRFVGSSNRPGGFFSKPRIHHVFVQGKFCDFGTGACSWKNIDATYKHYNLFQPKKNITRAIIFERGGQ